MRVEDEEDGVAGELDLRQIARALSAKRWWIILPTLAALAGAALFVNIVKPRYTAEARLLLESQENFLPRAEKVERINESAPDAEAVQSQVELLKSRDLARRAIKKLNLAGDEELDPVARGLGFTTRMLIALGVARDPTKVSPEDRILETFLDKRTILSPQKTRVMTVEFNARDPDLAASCANAIADAYIEFQQDAKRSAARDAAKTLGALVVDLRRRVAEAEAEAEAFRASSGLLLGANNITINAQHLSDLNTQLSLSRSAQADAQAKAHLLKDMLRQNRIGDIPDVANNEVMRRLQEQRVTLRAQLALELRTLLPGHPRVKELEAQLADLDRQGRAAAERVVRTLENDARIAGARVENLQQALDAQKKIVGASDADDVKLRELDRQAHVLKDQYETSAAKYQEALARENAEATPADARVFQRALAPQQPSFPNKPLTIAFATLATLALSMGAIVLGGLLSGGSRLAPALPTFEASEEPAPPPETALVEEPKHVEEPKDEVSAREPPRTRGVRSADRRQIVSTIDAARLDAPCVKVLVAGGVGSAASLTTVLTLARALSRRGRAILVAVDSDGLEALTASGASRAGLAELLAAEAEFGDVIQRDAFSPLHLIIAGETETEPRYDIGVVIAALAQTYDFLVFCAYSSDLVLELAAQFDKVLLRAEDPRSPLLARLLANSCEDVSVVEDADDCAAAA